MRIALASDHAGFPLPDFVYPAVCQDPFCAGLARSHSDTNVLCIGGKIIGSALALEVVRSWMTTEFLGDDEKYRRRVDKVREISERHLRPLPPG
jgi:ribose 5-phosphate isomerase B